MMLTWTANPVSYEQAFDAIKAGIDSLPPGVKMFLNSGKLYVPGLDWVQVLGRKLEGG